MLRKERSWLKVAVEVKAVVVAKAAVEVGKVVAAPLEAKEEVVAEEKATVRPVVGRAQLVILLAVAEAMRHPRLSLS